MSQRRSVQLAAAAVAHCVRGDVEAAEQVVWTIAEDTGEILAAFARLCVVTGEALALTMARSLADVLPTVPPVDDAPIAGAAILRREAVRYVVGLAEGDRAGAGVASASFGDAITAINSTGNLAAGIVHALAGGDNPANVASSVATLMAVTTVASPAVSPRPGVNQT